MSDETLRTDDGWEGPRSEGPGGQIGPYRIVSRLGEGGFGVVFEAEQEQPVKRRVALKVIKLGMDTREVIARFEAERQALAMMDHPHIARVLDAGATASGRPYFVMELVQGEPIAAFCDHARLSVRDRLALFDQVCTAVQHAHTKGVIHRDLKPSNVLVSLQDGQPFTKVIDFGIAKATSGKLTDLSLHTGIDQVIGTPLYMSPEQAAGSADIDTRTDVYSLGVILYELLTGSTPVQASTLRSALFSEIQRLVCEVEPPRPSQRLSHEGNTLSGVAERRASEPRRLVRTVAGELDWIVMKALEKERGRRYETANGLAMDLRRYLAAEPVLAAPPSTSYRMRKFIRRNKGAVATGSLVAASLLVGIVAFATQARIAQKRAAELEQVSQFQAQMLAQVDPTAAGEGLSADVHAQLAAALKPAGAQGASQLAAFDALWQQVNPTDLATHLLDESILKPAVSAIDAQFKAQPKVDAALRQVLAARYIDLGLYEAATPLQAAALATRRRELGVDDPATLDSLDTQGELLLDQGDFAGAARTFGDELARRRRVQGNDHPETQTALSNLAVAFMQMDKNAEAEPLLREALQSCRRTLGDDHVDTLSSILNLSVLLQRMRQLPEAEALAREAVERSKRTLGPDDQNTLISLGNLATLLVREQKRVAAEPVLRESLAALRRVMGENHPRTLVSLNNLGQLLAGLRRYDEAEALLRDAYERSRRTQGEEAPMSRDALNNLATVLVEEGKLEQAEPLVRASLELRRRVLGPDALDTLTSITVLGEWLEASHRHQQVLDLLLPLASDIRAKLENQQGTLALFLLSLGNAHAGLGQHAQAEKALLEARERLVAISPDDPDARDAAAALARLYIAWEQAQPRAGHDAQARYWQHLAQPDKVATAVVPRPQRAADQGHPRD
ncbi:MAG: tetratricopeptide repeat protein [Arenimonas sp.]